jgi:quercetin dioxygenase-like cupin family protein
MKGLTMDKKNCCGCSDRKEALCSSVMTLNEMIAYQPNSVVSRTLMDKTSGTVTLFAFDKGQGLSEHTAPFDAMVQVLDGEAEIKISGQPFNLKTGQCIIMPADKPHALRAITSFKMLLTMIR